MNYNKKVDGLKIGYIGGGSMNWAWELMGDLALEESLGGEVNLYDIDHESIRANEIIGNKISESPQAVGKWKYRACFTLEETLRGADFVVISILPGTFDEMASDVDAPQKYGIYQPVGDTTGPGGIIRAMRTIPMYVEIAEAIKAFSPKAWVINYTNPMSVCVNTLHCVFPDIKAFGCCHQVFGTQELLKQMILSENAGLEIARDDIKLTVLGLNHFSWITEASWNTYDLLPLFDKYANEHMETGFPLTPETLDKNNHFRSINKVCFDLYRRYGAIPVEGDRHLAEFMPPWYLKDAETIERFGFGLTPITYRKKKREELLIKSARLVSGEEAIKINKSGEEGSMQIKALCGLTDIVTNINYLNRGHMDGLENGAVVEGNAYFKKGSVQPIFAGTIPDSIKILLNRHAHSQKQLTKAGIKKDINLAFSVFINDPLVTLPIAQAEELFTLMVNNTKGYLQGWGV